MGLALAQASVSREILPPAIELEKGPQTRALGSRTYPCVQAQTGIWDVILFIDSEAGWERDYGRHSDADSEGGGGGGRTGPCVGASHCCR